MSAHRIRMFGIGAAAALALGLWQTDTASAGGWGRRGCGYGGGYYGGGYYGGCAPVYYSAPCYPVRSYYSESYCYPRPYYRPGFSVSVGYGHGGGYYSHRGWGGHRRGYGYYGGRRGWGRRHCD